MLQKWPDILNCLLTTAKKDACRGCSRAKAYERRPLTERELGIVRKKRDERYYVSRFMSVEHKQLARANINGVEVEGIQINSAEPFEVIPSVESFVGRLWFDVVTDLLVLIELEFVPAGLFH